MWEDPWENDKLRYDISLLSVSRFFNWFPSSASQWKWLFHFRVCCLLKSGFKGLENASYSFPIVMGILKLWNGFVFMVSPPAMPMNRAHALWAARPNFESYKGEARERNLRVGEVLARAWLSSRMTRGIYFKCGTPLSPLLSSTYQTSSLGWTR